ncbi:MAG: SDR family NAD(P)-dependent oxidoreductase [Nitrososphaeria archaeon]|jgi:3-oxoacyl-[acyl-carrier protein] reductase
MNRELDGKKALITGASTGIGASTAITFAREGASVIINYRSSEQEAREVMKKARELGAEAYVFKADVTNEAEIAELMKFVESTFGYLDVLVNNAGGLLERREIASSDLEYWRRHIDLNLTSVYLVTKNALPLLLRSPSNERVIVNVSSIAAFTGGGRGAFAYASAKGGVKTLTRAMAKELAQHKVRVVAVMPGLIVTPFHEKARTGDVEGWAEKQVLLKRAGSAQEVAEVIAFLASERASYVNSTEIYVDGGWLYG